MPESKDYTVSNTKSRNVTNVTAFFKLFKCFQFFFFFFKNLPRYFLHVQSYDKVDTMK